jgi:hypothetical protein
MYKRREFLRCLDPEILPINPIAITEVARKENAFCRNSFLAIVIEDGTCCAVGWNEN